MAVPMELLKRAFLNVMLVFIEMFDYNYFLVKIR
jgi:hypothetical protein